MVQVKNYALRERKDGETFIALELLGGLELVQSSATGKFYATVKKCSIPSTLDEATARLMVGHGIYLRLFNSKLTLSQFTALAIRLFNSA